MKNKEWSAEQKRVDYTVDKINEEKSRLEKRLQNVEEDASVIRKTFWDDVTVNFDEPDDVAETATSIRQQAELLSERERSYRHMDENLFTLEKLSASPYFARVDLKEDDGEVEELYIGISSFADKQDNYLVYDWRAPISSVYYDGVPGEVSYRTPVGMQKGEMLLKRQFLIKSANIQSMFDTTVTIGDEMLQAMLGANAQTHMKNIVSTIQREQNRIIRDTLHTLILVQGSAGSGKTSVAIQRVAFLLYHFRETLQANEIILFSPNALFNDYVSKVLPDLGEKNMVQTTFHDYIQSRIGKGIKIKDRFEQFEEQINTGQESKNHGLQLEKTTSSMLHVVDKYVQNLDVSSIYFKSLKLKGKTIVSRAKMKTMFDSIDASFSVANRMSILQKDLLKHINTIAKKEQKEEWVQKEIELSDRETLLESFRYVQRKNQEEPFDTFDQEYQFLAKKIVNKYFKLLRSKIKQFRFIQFPMQYIHFIQHAKAFGAKSPANEWEMDAKHLKENWNIQPLYMEDALLYIYLKDVLLGKPSVPTMKHVFIDEVQDYTPAQLAYIKFLYPYSKYTLLGDLHQTIYTQNQTSPFKSMQQYFDRKDIDAVTLAKSYRSTMPITRFSQQILKEKDVVGFDREGTKPNVHIHSKKDTYFEGILHTTNQLAEKSHSVALIGKSLKDCEEAFHYLKDKLPIHFITPKDGELKEGVVIIPSYLAKGLEFDHVVVFNASEEIFFKETERTLLYTICTRAMHSLNVFVHGKMSQLLESVAQDCYQRISY